jgi:hypothetical protein
MEDADGAGTEGTVALILSDSVRAAVTGFAWTLVSEVAPHGGAVDNAGDMTGGSTCGGWRPDPVAAVARARHA